MGLAIALALSATAEAKAQTDTTRRATSEQRIPVRKEQRTGAATRSGTAPSTTTSTAPSTKPITRREAGGEVRLSPTAVAAARIDSLEAVATEYRTRLDALEAANATLTSRSESTDRTIAALNDSLKTVRGELTTARAELTSVRTDLTATTARTGAIADSLRWLNQRFVLFRNHSLFGNSGFYAGLGTGANFTTGTLRDAGYSNALHLTLPIGWSKPGNLIGVRGELGYQRLEGRLRGTFVNPDPKVYSAVGMVTLNMPINTARSNTFYAMGGGGVYQFHHIGGTSALSSAFDGESSSKTTWGLTAGAGLEFHILGATSLFTQTAFTSVSPDQGGRLNWIPLVVGVQLR
jgi:opacity protein-like surface antigen